MVNIIAIEKMRSFLGRVCNRSYSHRGFACQLFRCPPFCAIVLVVCIVLTASSRNRRRRRRVIVKFFAMTASE
jgi:hypothetical protein